MDQTEGLILKDTCSTIRSSLPPNNYHKNQGCSTHSSPFTLHLSLNLRGIRVYSHPPLFCVFLFLSTLWKTTSEVTARSLMEKPANQGGEQHKYTRGFFGHQPGSTESAAPVPMGKHTLKGRRVRARKEWGTFQCYGNHADKYLQAAGPVTMNKEGSLSRTR